MYIRNKVSALAPLTMANSELAGISLGGVWTRSVLSPSISKFTGPQPHRATWSCLSGRLRGLLNYNFLSSNPRGHLFATAGGAGFIERLFDRFAGFTRALLDPANQFFGLAFSELEIVIRKLGPFLFQLAFGDVPVAFDFECVHDGKYRIVCLFFVHRQCDGKRESRWCSVSWSGAIGESVTGYRSKRTTTMITSRRPTEPPPI
jgi:hypothetical protein